MRTLLVCLLLMGGPVSALAYAPANIHFPAPTDPPHTTDWKESGDTWWRFEHGDQCIVGPVPNTNRHLFVRLTGSNPEAVQIAGENVSSQAAVLSNFVAACGWPPGIQTVVDSPLLNRIISGTSDQ